MMPELQEPLIPLTGSDLQAVARQELRILLAAALLQSDATLNVGIDQLTIEYRGIRFKITVKVI